MKIGKKTKIRVSVLILGLILWQFGFFTRFNYLTAKIDIWKDSPRIASYGLPYPCDVTCIALKEKYGFHESNVGCIVTESQIRGIDAYNAQIEKYLNKRNGKDWRKKYLTEMNSMIKNNMPK